LKVSTSLQPFQGQIFKVHFQGQFSSGIWGDQKLGKLLKNNRSSYKACSQKFALKAW